MIREIATSTLRITVYEASKNVEIKDVNGVGMVMDIDQFKEFKEMVDFIYGANNLWRYTSDNEPTPLR